MNHIRQMNACKLFWLVVTVVLAVLVMLLTGVQVVRADPSVIYVDRDAPGPIHDGLFWTTAYTTVQDALDVTDVYSATAYEIWVAAGTYYPDEGGGRINNQRTYSFRINYNNVQLYGGFSGYGVSETLRTERDWFANPTILSGDIDQSGDLIDNAYHVLWIDGVTNEPITNTTVIDGFIITGGNANGSTPDSRGGGLFCAGNAINRECSPTLSNIVFIDNIAAGNGGGMYNRCTDGGACYPILTNVIFSDNSGTYGGGMFNYSGYGGASNPILTNTIFSGNSAIYGGGMFNYSPHGVSNPTLINVTFSGNLATYGGGMGNDSRGSTGMSRPELINVTFSGNSATYGGGMYNYVEAEGESSPTLVNCILWDNDASMQGHQLYNDGATPVLRYTLIQSGTDDIVGGTVTYGPGILTSDPQFIAPISASYAPTTTGNYRLDFGSPAIDTGDNLSVTVSTDLDGNPRIIGGTVDMGAYEAIPDLTLSKSVTPTTDVLYHGVVTYTIVLSNTGIGSDANVILTDTLPTGIAFRQWVEQPTSGLVRSGDAITWTGTVTASSSITFTFTATRTGSLSGDMVNTAYYSGTLQKDQATATFTTGSMVCDVENGRSYTFNNQSGVSIAITTLGDELDCLYVDEIGTDHPFATGDTGGSGIKTGRYWQIRGLQDDGVTDAIGFTVVLTLPHTGLIAPKVCRYTGGAGYGWDCAADDYDGSTVWRAGITLFSEWAVGQNVGPTSLALHRLAASSGLRGLGVLLALTLTTLITVFGNTARKWRARCAMGR